MDGASGEEVVVVTAAETAQNAIESVVFKSVSAVFRKLQRDRKAYGVTQDVSSSKLQIPDNMICESIHFLPRDTMDKLNIQQLSEPAGQQLCILEVKEESRGLSNETGLEALWDHNGIGLLLENNECVVFIIPTLYTQHAGSLGTTKTYAVKANLLAAHKQYLETGIISSDLGIEVLKPKIPKPTTSAAVTASTTPTTTTKPNQTPHSTGCTLAPGTTCSACGHTA